MEVDIRELYNCASKNTYDHDHNGNGVIRFCSITYEMTNLDVVVEWKNQTHCMHNTLSQAQHARNLRWKYSH